MIRAFLIFSLFGIGTFVNAESDDLANILENAHIQTTPQNGQNSDRKVTGERVETETQALELYNHLRESNQINAETPAVGSTDAD